ncbi:MAG: gamma-glutamyl-gamma-aminobutyrate hydrolase family protein [Anaerolineae bacterium]|nr:gamma-glutamyl-gamma-aminobutyrate hydrolase family protein [Anaerolineae bacterium]
MNNSAPKKFAVSLNTRQNGSGLVDSLAHFYVDYLHQLDVVPILVPNNITDINAYLTAVGADGLLLTGGSDLDPVRYGQPDTHAVRIMPARDTTEFALLDWATAHHAPVIGICRGIQTINVYWGGSLVQDIPAQIGTQVNHDETTHPITLIDDQFAALIGARTITVNSFHHQAATVAMLANDLVPFAISEPDGIVEGVYHRTQPILGVQWHPERAVHSRETDLKMFRHFLAQGMFWRG